MRESVMGSVEAEGLKALMATQHKQNRDDIEKLQSGQEELTKSLTTLTGEISGATRVLRFFAWLVMAMLAALGIWLTSLEARGKVSDNKPPAAVSSYQSPQQDAARPYLPPR